MEAGAKMYVTVAALKRTRTSPSLRGKCVYVTVFGCLSEL